MNEILVGLSGVLIFAAFAWYGVKQLKREDLATRIAARQLEQARIARLEHIAAYEHHKALADMYDVRVRRLDPTTAWVIDDTRFTPL